MHPRDRLAECERAVGQAVYERVAKLMDAKPDTPEARELVMLAEIVSAVEAELI